MMSGAMQGSACSNSREGFSVQAQAWAVTSKVLTCCKAIALLVSQ